MICIIVNEITMEDIERSGKMKIIRYSRYLKRIKVLLGQEDCFVESGCPVSRTYKLWIHNQFPCFIMTRQSHKHKPVVLSFDRVISCFLYNIHIHVPNTRSESLLTVLAKFTISKCFCPCFQPTAYVLRICVGPGEKNMLLMECRSHLIGSQGRATCEPGPLRMSKNVFGTSSKNLISGEITSPVFGK
jgi:hypothetical protein